MTNTERLKGCDPDLVRKALAVVSDLAGHGLTAMVTQGLRTQAEQDALYEKGRSKPGHIVTWTHKSNHITGRAADFAFVVKGKVTWNVPDTWWAMLASSARAHDLVAGYDWHGKKQDRCHVELKDDKE